MRKTVAAVNQKATKVADVDDLGTLRDAVALIAAGSFPIRQVVLVTATSWTSDKGSLHLFSKVADRWLLEEKDIPVMLGENGLGWGSGIHQSVSDPPQKVEGDSKAPAGVFRLGSAFGYDTDPPADTLMPYRCISENDYFVDDVQSDDYNQWMRLDGDTETPQQMWNSWEEMKRPDHLYELGAVVEHNAAPVVKGKGSANFPPRLASEGSANCRIVPPWRRRISPALFNGWIPSKIRALSKPLWINWNDCALIWNSAGRSDLRIATSFLPRLVRYGLDHPTL